MDEIQYKDIKQFLSEDVAISGFDMYYLGFLSYHDKWRNLDEIFDQIRKINSQFEESLRFDQKIKSFVGDLYKKIDPMICGALPREGEEMKRMRAWDHIEKYLSWVKCFISELRHISKPELFFLGRFHAIYPFYRIDQKMKEIEELNRLTEMSFTEEDKVERVIEILRSKKPELPSGQQKLYFSSQSEMRQKMRGFDVKTENTKQEYLGAKQEFQNSKLESRNSMSFNLNTQIEDYGNGDKKGLLAINKAIPPAERLSKGDEQTIQVKVEAPSRGNIGNTQVNVNKANGNNKGAGHSKMHDQKLDKGFLKPKDHIKSQNGVFGSIIEQKANGQQAEFLNYKCGKCKKDLKKEFAKGISTCKHQFHGECFREYLKDQIRKNTVSIQCPEAPCNNIIRLADMMDYANQEELDKYTCLCLKSYIESHSEIFCCPNPECCYFFEKEESDKFECPVCKEAFCMKCKTDWHGEDECRIKKEKLSKEEELLQQKLESKSKRCPKCKRWANRSSNLYMISDCGAKFCYTCGQDYKHHICKKKESFFPVVKSELFHK